MVVDRERTDKMSGDLWLFMAIQKFGRQNSCCCQFCGNFSIEFAKRFFQAEHFFKTKWYLLIKPFYQKGYLWSPLYVRKHKKFWCSTGFEPTYTLCNEKRLAFVRYTGWRN